MARAPSRSSSASLVSVDPAVASHIINTSTTEDTRKSSTAGSNKALSSRTNSSRYKEKAIARKLDQTRKDGVRGRGNSLRRVKNSTEVLRQRTLKPEAPEYLSESLANTREGRNFTVGNVGTGGFLYLRPAVQKPQPTPQNLPSVLPPTPPKSASLSNTLDGVAGNDELKPSVFPPTPYAPSTTLKRSTTNAERSQATPAGLRRRGRSYSFSSVDDRKSFDSRPGAFRIVINRSTPTRSLAAPSFTLTTLEVPIPHYRLGTPRFSTQGTAILRSSVNTGISGVTSDSYRTPSFTQPDLLFPAPPGSGGRRLLSSPSHNTDLELEKMNQRTSRSSGSTLSDQPPLTPTLFDGLAQMQDHPSVVRYSPKTGEIMAATPARIVAQISSESFMDYELVSDFFLTFRTYMSTHQLLDLLLARLRWAINRLEDDGRIVRIRTFAALRHWILNYFMDDFVLNRKLRVRFCQQINDMYSEVYARPSGGSSDLKILQDLKRCWNGRCSIYWDSPEFAIDTSLDWEIMPGGIVGNRDSTLSEPFMFDPGRETIVEAEPNTPRQRPSQSWFGKPPPSNPIDDQHKHDSAFMAFGPESPRSDLSVQPSSCSIPMTLSRWPATVSHPTKGPHPVPVQMRRQKAPSNLAVSTNPPFSYKRSVSSLDSSRKSTPVPPPPPQQRVILPSPYAESLIRGQIYPPASAIVEVLSSVTATTYHDKVALDQSHGKPGSPTNNPAMKSIFGSIRRALGGKQGLGDLTLLSVPDSNQQGPLRGKILTKTLVSTKSHDELRRMVDSRPVRSQMRIDLLCAAIVQSYEIAISSTLPEPRQDVEDPPSGITTKYVVNRSIPVGNANANDLVSPRFYSQATAQSGSILIVDETKLDLPIMSGALPPVSKSSAVGQDARPSDYGRLPKSQSTYLDPPTANIASQRSSGLFGTERIASAMFPTYGNPRTENLKHWSSDPELTNTIPENKDPALPSSPLVLKRATASTATTTVTMRRAGSFGSTIDHQGAESSVGATRTSVSSPQDDEDDDIEMSKSHTLRRRPGGDLKKTQHVHDLEALPRAQSFDSAFAATDSAGGSLIIMANSEVGGNESTQQAPGQRTVSMINTHSSQHLRPSFEAAIAGFSAIPDDDDGGLEATLLKLEGRYDPASPALAQGTKTGEGDDTPRRSTFYTPDAENETIDQDTNVHDVDNSQIDGQPISANVIISQLAVLSPTPVSRSQGPANTTNPLVSTAYSADSYNLIPLLERGQAEELYGSDERGSETPPLSAPLLVSPQSNLGHVRPGHSISNTGILRSADVVRTMETERNSTFLFPDPSASVRSFLLDEDENLSDLSSEISVDIINQSDLVTRPFSPMFAAPGTARSGLELPSHPLGHYSDPHLVQPRTYGKLPQRMPPTPDPSPKMTQGQQNWKSSTQGLSEAQFPLTTSSNLGHIPFILACDSQVLAQQFTLVEKAALSEVEWIDLVDMRWENKAASIVDWVQYLSTKNNKGIDLVITRFNLVVKWALSEIVLTQNIHERARTIIKLIHTAAHARRLHNYATMLQLTIALTSTDCTRLTKTWELISAPDRSLLKNMEALIQPLRNFHDLREEMESADLSEGCIPFIGLYIHDLTYNAQKPSQIAGTRDSEPLVNFERYRTAATIIKGLLRLIDASSRYEIAALEGVVERCLWMASLDDAKIRSLSKALETKQ